MIIGLIVCFEMETQLVTPIIRLYRGSFAQRHTPCLMSIAIVLVSDLQKPALKYKKGVYVGKVLLLKCYASPSFITPKYLDQCAILCNVKRHPIMIYCSVSTSMQL